VLLRKWLQPSGFTQNVQRTRGIVSGQDVILQALGVITRHSPHDNAPDRRGGEEEPHPSSSGSWRAAMHWSGKRFAGCRWFRPQPAGNPQQNFRRLTVTSRPNALTWVFPVRPLQLESPNAQEFSFASSRSGIARHR
jgi:hypothetical protein